MIYLGFNLYDAHSIDITALDDNFIFIGEKSIYTFYQEDSNEFQKWFKSISLYDDEEVLCFFCERQFLSLDINYFSFIPQNASVYLVKDRLIQNLYKLFHGFYSSKGCYSTSISIPFLLAVAEKLIDEKFIYLFNFRKNVNFEI